MLYKIQQVFAVILTSLQIIIEHHDLFFHVNYKHCHCEDKSELVGSYKGLSKSPQATLTRGDQCEGEER